MNGRVVAGFFVSPLVPGALVGLFTFATQPQTASATAAPAMILIGALLGSLVWGYPAACVFGIPAYLLLSRLRARSLLAYIAGAAIVGSAYVALFKLAVNHAEVLLSHILNDLEFGGFFGAFAGAAFWFITRPDKEIPANRA